MTILIPSTVDFLKPGKEQTSAGKENPRKKMGVILREDTVMSCMLVKEGERRLRLSELKVACTEKNCLDKFQFWKEKKPLRRC